ncbi:MAG: hypothetical protein GKR90_13615 [Pseudomonadales bacterium]|nr:hypothetical protein [Pseudomonadales bacterium]
MRPPLSGRVDRIVAGLWVVLLACLFISTVVSIPAFPGRDSSVFIYVGDGLLDGALPYIDRWDHKPPLVFLLDAIALSLSDGSLWGIWVMEALFLLAVTLIAFTTISRVFGQLIGGFAVSMLLLQFGQFLDGGNLTEEYALLFQFLAVQVFLRTINSKLVGFSSAIALGVLGAFSFLLKPSLIGIWLGIGCYWLMAHPWNHTIRLVGNAVVGATIVFALFAAYLLSFSSGTVFVDAVFSYSLAYTNEISVAQRFDVILALFETSALAEIALVTWLIGVILVVTDSSRNKLMDAILKLALVLVPIELILISTSGRSYLHYYLTSLPTMTLLFALFGYQLHSMSTWFLPFLNESKNLQTFAKASVLFLPLLLVSSQVASIHPTFMENLRKGTSVVLGDTPPFTTNDHTLVVEAIRRGSFPQDPILVWGAEPQIYFFSKRKAPTRFFYQYPLVTPGYNTDQVFEGFLASLTNDNPVFVVDTYNPYLPPLDPVARLNWPGPAEPYVYDQAKFEDFFAWFNRNYDLKETINNFTIYKRADT